jgi:hypothetical protein
MIDVFSNILALKEGVNIYILTQIRLSTKIIKFKYKSNTSKHKQNTF